MRKSIRNTLALVLSAALLTASSSPAWANDDTGSSSPAPEESTAPVTEPLPDPTPGPTAEPAETAAPSPTPESTEPTAAPEASEEPETSASPEPSATPELPEAGTVLAERETAVEPTFYTSGLSGGLTFTRAVRILLDDITLSIGETSASLAQDGEAPKVVFSYGESSAEECADALPYLAAALAARTGKTADDLQNGTLSDGELTLLRTLFRSMQIFSCALTEKDIASGEADENGEPAFTTEREVHITWSLTADALQNSLDTAAYARYKDLLSGPEKEKLVSLCSGFGWAENGAGESVTTLREDVVRLALAQQGKITYRWNGKYNRTGADKAWGFPQQDENGTIYTDGLDCSGFISWVFINAAGTVAALPSVGEGTNGQLNACDKIALAEVQPGDLVFCSDGTAESEHIGIVTSVTSDGRVLMCHCSEDGVTVDYADEYGMDTYLRPTAYYAAYETSSAVPEISLTEYADSADGTLWLVKVSEDPGIRCRWTFDGKEMLWSETYEAWCTLTTDAEGAESRIARVRQSGKTVILYTGDANDSGRVDINDAQVIYSMAHGRQSLTADNTAAWLAADLNGDGALTLLDAAAILTLI